MIRIPSWFLGLLVVALFLGFATVAMAEDAKGKVVSAEGTKLVVDVDGKSVTFSVGDKAKVSIGGKEGKLGDLKKGDEVIVVYKKEGDKMIASEVTKK
jgi:hypothetical protein